MCYSGNLALVTSHRDLVLRRRWYVLQANMAVDNHMHTPGFAVGEGGSSSGSSSGSGSGGSVKRYCLCSPTRHPGSFRCRQHHGEYAWGSGRVVRNRVE